MHSGATRAVLFGLVPWSAVAKSVAKVVLVLIGCGMLGLGLWLHLAYSGYTTLLPSYAAFSADSLCMALGIFIFIVGFFGCCGSWFHSKCLLVTYFFCVVLIFIAELLAGTFGFIYRAEIGGVVKDELKMGIKEKYNGTSKLVDVWRHIQLEFKCCGVSSFKDWFNITAWPEKSYVPSSCCSAQYRNYTNCGMSQKFTHYYDRDPHWPKWTSLILKFKYFNASFNFGIFDDVRTSVETF
ncbi:Tetraspanin-9 [Nymphon striatum]|nr:Tetraspanin-9 [Nymphon striatum]